MAQEAQVIERTSTWTVKAASEAGAAPHDIIIVGGGAGLELVTRLGRKLGKRGKAAVTLVERARTHLWKPLLHQVAAGSLDIDEHDLDYLAQAHWSHFRYRFGEMTGLDRATKRVKLAATYDEDGRKSRLSVGSPTTRSSSRSEP